MKGQIFSKLNIHAQSSSLTVPKVASDDLLLQLMTRKFYFFRYKLYAGHPGFKGTELLGAPHFSEHMASLVCCMVLASNLREVAGTNLKNATI